MPRHVNWPDASWSTNCNWNSKIAPPPDRPDATRLGIPTVTDRRRFFSAELETDFSLDLTMSGLANLGWRIFIAYQPRLANLVFYLNVTFR
eukprot:1188927-Prorocentrum_minimum.AAC.2